MAVSFSHTAVNVGWDFNFRSSLAPVDGIRHKRMFCMQVVGQGSCAMMILELILTMNTHHGVIISLNINCPPNNDVAFFLSIVRMIIWTNVTYHSK